MESSTIRPARPADVAEIVAMVRELAAYEQAEHEAIATDDLLTEALFGETPAVFALIAEHEGATAGFALYFLNFSTWLGRHGIYLEDLYVRPAFRGLGIGKALLAELARLCTERGYGRLEWWVLDWNEPALGFYRSIGAEPMSEWTVHRLSRDPLQRLARHASRELP